jgi:TolB-like protein
VKLRIPRSLAVALVCGGGVLLPIATSAQVRLSAGIDSLAAKISATVAGQGKRKIAVLPFRDLNGRPTVFGAFISEELVTRLVNGANLEVVERALLNQALAELKLGQSGAIDPQTAAQVGRFAGVQAIVTGTTTDLGSSVFINCRLIAVETGQIAGAASTQILKDDDVRSILAEREADDPAESGSVKRDRLNRTIYFGGDWLTVRFVSIEMVEGNFLRLTFNVQNPFDGDADLRLNNPAQNTYLVDNRGNSYNFMSGEGLDRNFALHIRAGESVQLSLLFKAPGAAVRFVTLRTVWDGYGRGLSGSKRFVQDNLHIPGR